MRRLVALSLGALFLITACSRCGGSGSSSSGGTGGGGGTSTSDAKHFFLPTLAGDNTTAPVVALDGSGGLHSVYPAFAKGGAYYTYCANGCASATDVSYVHFTTDETVLDAMLALTSSGKPRVLMNTGAQVYYASCDSGCTDMKGWTVTSILRHEGKKEVSGRGFALDASGRPRFILHTTVTYLGVGQGDPLTEYVVCDSNCTSASAWKSYTVASSSIWDRPELRIDPQGGVHVSAALDLPDNNGGTANYAAYIECKGDCTQESSWKGTGLLPTYSSVSEAITIYPTTSLALTSSGAPRVAMLARDGSDKKVAYLACDTDCSVKDNWTVQVVSSGSALGDGVDLALDPQDHPRLAFTSNYNIVLGSCDATKCATTDAKWNAQIIEDSSNMKADEIFLYTNCNASAWFLHTPSIVLTKDGGMRVGYQARDVSGGWVKTDPKGPDCPPGTDMSWSRLAVVK